MLFCQNGDKIRFKMCGFLYSYMKKKSQLRFSHNYTVLSLINLIIHDDKTVISYFMPRYQILSFHIILKLKDRM